MEWTLYPFLALVLGEIAFVDYREHAIYDFDTLLAFALVFAYKYLIHALGMSLLFSLLGLLIGLIIFFVSYKVYGFEAFGFGDVLLLAVMGLWLSYDFSPILLLHSWSADLAFCFLCLLSATEKRCR